MPAILPKQSSRAWSSTSLSDPFLLLRFP
jgi:hypothetical protein